MSRAGWRCALLLLHLCLIETSLSHRHRRHRSSEDDDSEPPLDAASQGADCRKMCDAQFNGDYEFSFQRHYQKKFSEVPLDQTIINSTDTLSTYCEMVKSKFDCLRNCGDRKSEWSPERHICVDHYNAFLRANRCLRRTSLGVHRHCQPVCIRTREFVDGEGLKKASKQRLTEEQRASYNQTNNECHYIHCHHVCHTQMIEKLCPTNEQRMDARDVVDIYYRQMHQNDLEGYRSQGEERLFSAFCRSLIPGLDESKFVLDMRDVNNRTKQKIMALTKAAVDQV